MCYYNEIAGDCCTDVVKIKYRCEGSDYFICNKFLCLDGSDKKGHFCGVGACNLFGCACEGGCRTGYDEDNLRKQFADEHPHLKIIL